VITVEKYIQRHINLPKFGFILTVKFCVLKATSYVKNMKFCGRERAWRIRHADVFRVTGVLVSVHKIRLHMNVKYHQKKVILQLIDVIQAKYSLAVIAADLNSQRSTFCHLYYYGEFSPHALATFSRYGIY
jgi:hypothetical protein